ncbi:MAG: hypothetical protein QM756_20715 [Polyangiaceae bacterium]
MQAGALVVIWTLSSELSTPGTLALTSAAGEALGADTELRVEAAPDPEGMRLSDVGGASAVVRLTWDEAEHRRAHLLCYVQSSQRWIDREVVFEATDPERERGRTLGFLLASMLLNDENATGPEPARQPPKSVPAKDAASPSSAAAAQPVRPARLSTALSAGAELASAGAASGYGFWVAGERSIAGQALWMGASGHARFGSIDSAQASSRLLALGMHLTWFFIRTEPIWLGGRLGASLNQLSATRTLPGLPSETQSRILASTDVFAIAGVRFSRSSALSLQLGGEFLSGVTNISVKDQERATWPWAAFTGRAGVETAF